MTVVERTTTGTADTTFDRWPTPPPLSAMIELTRRVPAASHVLRHAVDLVVATQPGSPTIPTDAAQSTSASARRPVAPRR